MSTRLHALSKITSNTPGELADTDLIQRICVADHAAFEMLYKRYFQRLFRFSFRMTRRLDHVEEIINDVMWVVWNKASTFNYEARVSTWILGIAYKKCLKSISEQMSSEHLSLDDEDAEIVIGVRDKTMNAVELDDWLEFAFSRLPPDQRAVLELTFHHGLHYSEIAEIMGCPENTVKTRVFHARRKIQSLMPELLDDTHHDHHGEML